MNNQEMNNQENKEKMDNQELELLKSKLNQLEI